MHLFLCCHQGWLQFFIAAFSTWFTFSFSAEFLCLISHIYVSGVFLPSLINIPYGRQTMWKNSALSFDCTNALNLQKIVLELWWNLKLCRPRDRKGDWKENWKPFEYSTAIHVASACSDVENDIYTICYTRIHNKLRPQHRILFRPLTHSLDKREKSIFYYVRELLLA